ncbi:MAG: SRPBCC family protein [Alphaproteobacteria bacterium]
MSDLPEYVLDRVFDAPRNLVWRAWTDPEILHQWYGPNIETIIHKYDLRPGGVWLNEMKWGDNSDLSKAEFQEVVREEKLVWHHSSTDADWNTIPSPMMPDWPRMLLTTVTFEDLGDQTKVKLVWVPIDATEAELACFTGAVNNMGKGWESGYALIDELLVKMQARET